MSLWVPPSSIPAKNDGDALTAKDLKDVIASLQDLLNGRIGNVNINTALDLSERIAAFKVIFPGDVRFADDYATGSATGGIQEAIENLAATGGEVVCSGKEYLTSAPIWIHSGVHLRGSGSGSTVVRRATGSIVDGGANYTGSVLVTGPKGSNGTIFSSGTHGTGIAVTDIALDGNQANFTSLTNVNLTPVGIRGHFVDGLRLTNVTAQNCLMTGFYLESCTSFHLSGTTTSAVGQWSVNSDRNAVSLHSCSKGSVDGFVFDNTGDEAFLLADCQSVAVGEGSVNGCDFGIELGSDNNVDLTDLTFSNINFTGVRSTCITFNSTDSDYARCNFDNLTFSCDPTNHDAGVVYFASNSYNATDLTFSNITAVNVNSKDTSTVHWIDMQSASGKSRQRIFFDNINMSGKAGSTRTADVGILIRHDVQDVFFDTVLIKDLAGEGIVIDDAIADTKSNIHFDKVTVDGANYNGCRIITNTAAATMKGIYFDGCVMKDCAKQGAGSNTGFNITCGFAGSTIQGVYLRNCRSFKTSGTSHLYGLVLTQTAGTLDSVFVEGCDFSGTQTDWFSRSGTMSNIRFRPPPGRGTDIASAATIVIPPDGTVFHVTGTTNITNGITVNPWDNGRKAKLIFDGILTVSAAGTSKLAGAMVTTADDSLVLTCDGTNWNEDSRSINA